ncbi:MAG: tetratricopeptide repeat protein, partial [Bryobacteraceae bacterium]
EGLAVSAFSREDFEEARIEYGRLTELAPEQVEHWLNLGIALRRLNELADALPCFVRAREIRPDSLHAHTHLAETAWDLKEFSTARATYEAAIAKWSDREELTLGLSHLLDEMGLPEEAETVCVQYCARKTDKDQVWFRLGYLQSLRGAAEKSVESFEKALGLRPEWPEAEVNASIALIAAGQLDSAEAKLTSLLGRQPDHLEATKGLATIALTRNEDEKALDVHARLIELGEKTADVYYNCGVLSQRLERTDDAVRFYREAIALRKDFPEALLNLGHALKLIGEDDQARSLWIPALELDPELSLNYFRRR